MGNEEDKNRGGDRRDVIEKRGKQPNNPPPPPKPEKDKHSGNGKD
jgi:hypothetical protein